AAGRARTAQRDGRSGFGGCLDAPTVNLIRKAEARPGGAAPRNPVDGRRMFLTDDIEILNPGLPRGRFRSVLFDFDGTLSLIREGWPQVMIPMMVDVLRKTDTLESVIELTVAVEDFVMRLNGRQTIYQMMQLAEEVR